VQFPIELPPISIIELEKLLFSNIDEIMKDVPEDRWDSMHWGNIYHTGMKHYFQNVRHVTRYINSLKFGFEMVRAEVNAVDFLAMTCIQIFEPKLYDGIRDNKDVFSGLFYS
jgi:predicted KAP-like P-loop ATPase